MCHRGEYSGNSTKSERDEMADADKEEGGERKLQTGCKMSSVNQLRPLDELDMKLARCYNMYS